LAREALLCIENEADDDAGASDAPAMWGRSGSTAEVLADWGREAVRLWLLSDEAEIGREEEEEEEEEKEAVRPNAIPGEPCGPLEGWWC
jgi:hypothetical protein